MKSSWREMTEADVSVLGRGVKRGTVSPTRTDEEIVAFQKAASKASKYRNVKTLVDGIRFDSKREADYWLLLKGREQAGEITDLQRQVRFPLYCPYMPFEEGGQVNGRLFQVAEYVADFTFREHGQLIVVDAKARHIGPFALKAKWLKLQQNITIVEV